jgi:2Fe-2S ferredoxin
MSHPEITIKIIYEGDENIVSTFKNEYRSLMMLIRDKLYPEDFGACGGMGRCATCQVQLENEQIPISMNRNEQTTLSKQGISDSLTRLSCQLLIDVALNNATVTVLES